MITFKKNCSTCKRIKMEKLQGSEKTLNRLYQSRAYHRNGEPLTDIAKDLTHLKGFNGNEKTTYASIYNHTKYHQGLTKDDLIESRLNRSAKRRDNETIRALTKHNDVRQAFMDKGMEQLETGELELTAATVLGAANKQADIELKEKDQQIKLMEMVAMYQSGEFQKDEKTILENPDAT